MNYLCEPGTQPRQSSRERRIHKLFFFFFPLLSQARWTQNVLCELARREKPSFIVHVIWKARKETFKLLFKQVSFQLLLSSLSKSIILTFDMATARRGDWRIRLHIFLLMFSLLVAFGCGLFYSVVDSPPAPRATEWLSRGHKITRMYTGRAALPRVKYWTA